MSRDVTSKSHQPSEPRSSTSASRTLAGARHRERLDSWKEIANYVKRDVRTLHRWESNEAFPVHRHVHKQRATVWAYKDEVDAWIEGRRPRAERQRPLPAKPDDQESSGRASRTMLAVLPFANLTGDPENEYFSDGLTEETISRLGRLLEKQLGVIARTSVMPYKNTSKSILEIARELHADYLLEGSVRRAGGRVRITAQLIRASDATHAWAESYERELTDILKLHSEVARGIAEEIELRMTARERAELARTRPVDSTSYESYLKGMYFLRKFTPEGFERGLRYLNEAVERAPDDPLPWAGLALGYAMISHSDMPTRNPREAFARVRLAALRAVELDPASGEAHLALALMKFYYEWDFSEARETFERAIALNPNLAEARRHYAWCLLLFGQPEQAIAELTRAQALEPVAPIYTAELGWLLWVTGQREAGALEAKKALELSPEFPVALFVLGGIRAEQGRLDEAIALHQKAANVDPNWKWGLGNTLASAGKKDGARKILSELEDYPTPDAWQAFGLAMIHAGLGQDDETLHHLSAAVELRHGWMPWVAHATYFAHLQENPRFRELMSRIGSAV